MNAPLRLTAFAVVMALAAGGAAVAGRALNPTDSAGGGDPHAATGADHGSEPHASMPGAAGQAQESADDVVGGLAVSQDGYRLQLEQTAFAAGRPSMLRFQVLGPDGAAVRDGFEVDHERELHLIIVRRDMTGFQHLHPRRAVDGTWTIGARLPEAGVYRMFADFRIAGVKRTLATDLFVPGAFEPARLPGASTLARAGGLDVRLDAPELRPGVETTLWFGVTRDGTPFDELEPYLGAKGHLVALREGDLGYLHVHPTEGGEPYEHADGSTSDAAHANEIAFGATFPTPGRYRLFLQFKVAGEVRTVAHTVEVPR